MCTKVLKFQESQENLFTIFTPVMIIVHHHCTAGSACEFENFTKRIAKKIITDLNSEVVGKLLKLLNVSSQVCYSESTFNCFLG